MADIRINALATTATTPASDDYLALDGAAQGTRKILATNIANNVSDVILGTSGPSVKSTLSARAPRQGLVYDGSSNAPSISMSALGTKWTANFWVKWESNTQWPIMYGGGQFLGIRVGGTPFCAVELTSVTVPIGKWTMLTMVGDGTNTTPFINGVAGTAVADGANYGAPTTLGAAPAGSCLAQPLIYNRALSASEVVALYESGAPSAADYQTGGAGTKNTNVFVNSSFLPYTTLTGATAGLTAVIASGTAYAQSSPVFTVRIGSKVRVTGSISTAASTVYPSVSLTATDGTSLSSPTAITADGSFSIELTATVASSIATLSFFSTGSANYTVTSASVNLLGLLLAPDAAQAGNGYVWNDQSGNLAQIVLPSSGVQWNLPSVAGQRIRGTTSTNGNQQLLGASVLLPAECQITHVRARARSGTPTITIGTASGGAQIVASVALSTTWLNCTIALTGGIVSSADDIWVGSNSTDVVETDIAFQPLDF